MAKYLLEKDERAKEIIAAKYEKNGYVFHPKKGIMDINEIMVVNPSMIESLLAIKWDRSFHRLMKLAIKFIEDEDATEDDARIVLDEAEKQKEILLNKYKKYFKKGKVKLYLEKIRVLEKEISKKLLLMQEILQKEEVKEKHRSR